MSLFEIIYTGAYYLERKSDLNQSGSTSKIEITCKISQKPNQERPGGTCASFTSPGGGTKTMSLCHRDEEVWLLIIRDLPL